MTSLNSRVKLTIKAIVDIIKLYQSSIIYDLNKIFIHQFIV